MPRWIVPVSGLIVS